MFHSIFFFHLEEMVNTTNQLLGTIRQTSRQEKRNVPLATERKYDAFYAQIILLYISMLTQYDQSYIKEQSLLFLSLSKGIKELCCRPKSRNLMRQTFHFPTQSSHRFSETHKGNFCQHNSAKLSQSNVIATRQICHALCFHITRNSCLLFLLQCQVQTKESLFFNVP